MQRKAKIDKRVGKSVVGKVMSVELELKKKCQVWITKERIDFSVKWGQ